MEDEQGMGNVNDVLARGLELVITVKDIQGNQEIYKMCVHSKIKELVDEIKQKKNISVQLFFNSRLLNVKSTFLEEGINNGDTLYEKLKPEKTTISLFIKGPNGEMFNQEYDKSKTLKELFPNYINSYAVSCNARSINVETSLNDLMKDGAIHEKATLSFVIRTLGG